MTLLRTTSRQFTSRAVRILLFLAVGSLTASLARPTLADPLGDAADFPPLTAGFAQLESSDSVSSLANEGLSLGVLADEIAATLHSDPATTQIVGVSGVTPFLYSIAGYDLKNIRQLLDPNVSQSLATLSTNAVVGGGLAEGEFSGLGHAVLLTPGAIVPEPPAIVLAGAALAVLAGIARRRRAKKAASALAG